MEKVKINVIPKVRTQSNYQVIEQYQCYQRCQEYMKTDALVRISG